MEIRESLQYLGERFYLHLYRIRKGSTTHWAMCALYAHAIQETHSSEFDHSEIVHSCKHFLKRKILESLYCVNTQFDVLDIVSLNKYIFYVLKLFVFQFSYLFDVFTDKVYF